MRIARTVEELRKLLDVRADGFVPTLGALHEGHISLVRAARADGGVVVASIFVNPLQFGPGEDLAAYPRNEDRDIQLFESAGADMVFTPSTTEMYPQGCRTMVTVGRLGEILEGAHRPGHFEGVATVCAKLFNIVRPRRAFFGQKDAQQVAVLEQMVTDLNFDIEIVVCPTVRAADGLALSSRNAYLSPEQHDQALALYRSLQAGHGALVRGAPATEAQSIMRSLLQAAPGVTPDYAVACDPDTFEVPRDGEAVLLAVAAHVGPARLIDNMLWDPKSPELRARGGS